MKEQPHQGQYSPRGGGGVRGGWQNPFTNSSEKGGPESFYYDNVAPMNNDKLTAISLYTGAMGLDLGFEDQGFGIRLAVDQDKWAVETIEANRPEIPVIQNDISNITPKKILETAQLEPEEATVLIGAPPCEPFSTAGRRNGFQDHRAEPLREFVEVVKETRPRYFVLEEVKGLLSIAKKHISFYERVKKRPEQLDPDVVPGSGFKEIMDKFKATGYALSYDEDNPKASVLNAADYGVPQKRERFILIGARDGDRVSLPDKTHGRPESLQVSQCKLKPWVTLKEAIGDLDDPEPECMEFASTWRHFLEYVSEGGCWRDLPSKLQREALGNAYDDPTDEEKRGLKGGRTGFLRRLSWNKPAPTLVDRPTTRAGCMCHPDELRALSVKEYMRLQGFPDDWQLKGRLSAKYRLIGQATPVALAGAVATEVKLASLNSSINRSV